MTLPLSSRTRNLRDTNRRLGSCLDRIATCRQPAPVTPEDMAGLLSELLQARAELRANPIPPQGDDLPLDAELTLYRSNVERLRELLPSIHHQLLAERARLEAQRARVRSAGEWVHASRQTS